MTGTVKNNVAHPLSVSVRGTGYDSNGNEMGTGYDSVDIDPYGTGTYRINVIDGCQAGDSGTYDVRISQITWSTLVDASSGSRKAFVPVTSSGRSLRNPPPTNEYPAASDPENQAGTVIPPPGTPFCTAPSLSAGISRLFPEGFFPAPGETLLFFGHSGAVKPGGFPDGLVDGRFFATGTGPLNCTVFSRLKRPVSKTARLKQESWRGLAPLPLELPGAGSGPGTLRRRNDHGGGTVCPD